MRRGACFLAQASQSHAFFVVDQARVGPPHQRQARKRQRAENSPPRLECRPTTRHKPNKQTAWQATDSSVTHSRTAEQDETPWMAIETDGGVAFHKGGHPPKVKKTLLFTYPSLYPQNRKIGERCSFRDLATLTDATAEFSQEKTVSHVCVRRGLSFVVDIGRAMCLRRHEDNLAAVEGLHGTVGPSVNVRL